MGLLNIQTAICDECGQAQDYRTPNMGLAPVAWAANDDGSKLFCGGCIKKAAEEGEKKDEEPEVHSD